MLLKVIDSTNSWIDRLFNFLAKDFIIPLAFIQKETSLTQEQVNDYLGDIYTLQNLVVPLSIVFSVLGAGMIILAVYLVLRASKVRRMEALGIGMKAEYKKMHEVEENSFN